MADTTKAAPAPWDWQASGSASANGQFHCYIVDATGRKIAAVWGKGEEKEATATVMASAPNMVAALRNAAARFEAHRLYCQSVGLKDGEAQAQADAEMCRAAAEARA